MVQRGDTARKYITKVQCHITTAALTMTRPKLTTDEAISSCQPCKIMPEKTQCQVFSRSRHYTVAAPKNNRSKASYIHLTVTEVLCPGGLISRTALRALQRLEAPSARVSTNISATKCTSNIDRWFTQSISLGNTVSRWDEMAMMQLACACYSYFASLSKTQNQITPSEIVSSCHDSIAYGVRYAHGLKLATIEL
jgi:pectin methylesterase-like acyl-CoA thioesterase